VAAPQKEIPVLQVVVYLVLAYHHSPSVQPGWLYRRYVHTYTNKEACDAHASVAEKEEMRRRARMDALIAKPHGDTPQDRDVNAHFAEYDDYVCETVIPDSACHLNTEGCR
jgi:hypothetical protein